jgi:hypothetical protein
VRARGMSTWRHAMRTAEENGRQPLADGPTRGGSAQPPLGPKSCRCWPAVTLGAVGLSLVVGVVAAMTAHASTSLHFAMVRQQLTSGGNVQTSASFRASSCIAPEIGGQQTSASYRVEAGCTAIGTDALFIDGFESGDTSRWSSTVGN